MSHGEITVVVFAVSILIVLWGFAILNGFGVPPSDAEKDCVAKAGERARLNGDTYCIIDGSIIKIG